MARAKIASIDLHQPGMIPNSPIVLAAISCLLSSISTKVGAGFLAIVRIGGMEFCGREAQLSHVFLVKILSCWFLLVFVSLVATQKPERFGPPRTEVIFVLLLPVAAFPGRACTSKAPCFMGFFISSSF